MKQLIIIIQATSCLAICHFYLAYLFEKSNRFIWMIRRKKVIRMEGSLRCTKQDTRRKTGENEGDGSKEGSTLELIVGAAERTSVHGVSHILAARNPAVAVFWALLTAAAFGKPSFYKWFIWLCNCGHIWELNTYIQAWFSSLNSTHTCLSSYPGYFLEPHCFSMGLPEISRVTWQVCSHPSSPLLSS